MGRSLVFFVLLLFLQVGILPAQSIWDSSYVAEEPEVLVLRTYLSQKYTALYFPSEDLRYQPNSGLNMGIGVYLSKIYAQSGLSARVFESK